jgi:hypothetical protein
MQVYGEIQIFVWQYMLYSPPGPTWLFKHVENFLMSFFNLQKKVSTVV